jgi:hypothetical protein
MPKILGFIPGMPDVNLKVVGEEGEAHMNNYAGPYYFHTITVTKYGKTGKRTTKRLKVYSREGEKKDHWST